MQDYPSAEEHFVDEEVMFNSNAHAAIVIHKTGGDATPAAVYNTFKQSALLPHSDPRWGRSAHYAVGQDGSIWQFVPEAKGASANGVTDATTEPFWNPYRHIYGNLNLCTLSIEHCDPSGDNSTPLTSPQKEASFQLVAHLARKYNIPTSHIKPHKSICATTCPGNYPLDELIQFVQTGGNEDDMLQITDPIAASHFTQLAEDRWHCITTNIDIAYGILGFYRRSNGAPRLPLSGEKYDIPEVVYQVFEAGVIVYDPQHKLDHPTGFDTAYLLKLDSELAKKLLQ